MDKVYVILVIEPNIEVEVLRVTDLKYNFRISITSRFGHLYLKFHIEKKNRFNLLQKIEQNIKVDGFWIAGIEFLIGLVFAFI